MKKSELRKIIREELLKEVDPAHADKIFKQGIKMSRDALVDASQVLNQTFGTTYVSDLGKKYQREIQAAIKKVAEARSIMQKITVTK